ncbi:MAG: hypothetical protein AAFO07_10640 [Bacteroidota bacterium]
MKKLFNSSKTYASLFGFAFLVVFTLNWNQAQAQTKAKNCKVLLKSIQGSYDGLCLKGLASGEGTAEGEEKYKGTFKKGYPHGNGTYTYKNGDVYKGEFKQGKRNGKGKLTKLIGEDKYGVWKSDEFVRELFEEEHQVVIYRNISTVRCKVINQNSTRIEFRFTGGANIEEFDLNIPSGEVIQNSNVIRVENVNFPTQFRANYKVWNKLQTELLDVVLDVKLESEGNWQVNITH